ncbi:hypothetical protein FA039_10770 [Escherichia coli]|nr:hypothetical protein [Escherichia coli]
MKNIATGGVLERIRRLAPSHVTAPFKTVAEWREWQLSKARNVVRRSTVRIVSCGWKNSESLWHPAIAPQMLVCELRCRTTVSDMR